ncbi:MAG TPA: AsmA family protein [Lysobacter sp.]|nr:AsmA family protein [Lysobacter sp.]
MSDDTTTRTAPAFDTFRRHPWMCAAAVFAIALALLILFWDWNWFRKPICRVVQAKTERICEIGGDLDVDLGRVTRVSADAVRFGNASWSKRGDMARAKRIVVDFELWPALLHREFRIARLRMDRPDVVLETGPGGKGNWLFGDQSANTKAQFRSLWIEGGRLRFFDPPNKTDIDIEVASEAAKKTGEGAPILAQGSGRWKGYPFKLEGRGESPLELRNTQRPYRIDATASAGSTHAHAVGTLLDPLRFRDFDLRLALRGQNLEDLYPLLGIAIPPTPPYRLDGRLTRTIHNAASSTWKYDGFTGVVGDSDLGGYAHVTTGGERPYLRADLRSKRLDFDDLAGFVGAAPKAGGGESTNPELAAQAAKQAASPRLLPDTPYKLDKLRAMDADVRLRAGRINTQKIPLDDMDAHLLLENGLLRLDPLDFGVADGDIRSNIRMDARESAIRTRADIAAHGLDLAKLLPEVQLGKTAIGKVGGNIEIAGTGNSIARILGSADGDARMEMGEGRISKLLMEYAGLDLAGILRIKLTHDKQIPIRCMAADFAVKDGVMQARRMVFDSSETRLEGKGTINLRDETLDLTVRPRTKGFSPLSLRSPLYVRGSFRQPEFKPDYARMGLRAGAAVVLGTVAAPAAALLATSDLGQGKNAPCAPAPAK